MYKTVLVPVAFDHRPATERAMAVARHLLDKGGRLIALHVVEPVPTYVGQLIPERQLDAVREIVENDFRDELGEIDDVELAMVDGSPGAAIVEYAARQKVDCIVMASHKPGLQDYFLGGTAARVVRHANCDVHIVR